MELIISVLITWVIILVPPVVIRAVRRRPLTKAYAIAIPAVLFLANHILFAVMTGREGTRTFLAIGAFVSFYVLRWQSKAAAAAATAAQRRAMGYDA